MLFFTTLWDEAFLFAKPSPCLAPRVLPPSQGRTYGGRGEGVQILDQFKFWGDSVTKSVPKYKYLCVFGSLKSSKALISF